MRDLVDLVLLIETRLVTTQGLGAVVARVFVERGAHAVPNEIHDPPAFWAEGYRAAAAELDLRARTLVEATSTLRAFWQEAASA